MHRYAELNKKVKVDFHCRTHVTFTRVNKIEAVYERLSVNVKVDVAQLFTFTRDTLYTVSILYMRVKFTCIRM